MIGKAHGAERPTGITIRGPRLVLRALTPEEIDDEWLEMAQAGPMSIAGLPSEARSGSGWSDPGLRTAGSTSRSISRALVIGRIQTFVPGTDRCLATCSRWASAYEHTPGTRVTAERRCPG
jgi:hypothetical protein